VPELVSIGAVSATAFPFQIEDIIQLLLVQKHTSRLIKVLEERQAGAPQLH